MFFETEQQVPASRLRVDDLNPEVLERSLLLAFIIVTSICVMWHLGSSVYWLWTDCASHLHAAIFEAFQNS